MGFADCVVCLIQASISFFILISNLQNTYKFYLTLILYYCFALSNSYMNDLFFSFIQTSIAYFLYYDYSNESLEKYFITSKTFLFVVLWFFTLLFHLIYNICFNS